MCVSAVCAHTHPKHVVYILHQFMLRKKLALVVQCAPYGEDKIGA